MFPINGMDSPAEQIFARAQRIALRASDDIERAKRTIVNTEVRIAATRERLRRTDSLLKDLGYITRSPQKFRRAPHT